MNIRWQKLLVKTSFWLATEIILNLVGIDDLADYSEFVYENKNFLANIGCIFVISPMV
ncbi:hypothetical protein [Rivularia sp. UHCC 0363]|uniref:hypothetical protein n=1 Tax=Rivularia sp. UHCC 0363 TaxID=3110244 RepID=UPI002B1FA85D|nr:hypothetical protein [Rivularia sp. UHCC 0363]MEA5594648.1 hypothetical protein [Rivularia sp. UHCC 0363]